MLDPRVYRAAFVPAVLALIVAAFSLQEPSPGSSAGLAPDAFGGARAFDGPGPGLRPLAATFPQRRPGGAGDTAIARRMIATFRAAGLQTIIRRFSANTAVGHRRMQDVIGVRAGASNRRIVVLAHRDAVHAPATADLSGTATVAEQGEVAAQSLPAALVSVAGERGPGSASNVSQDQLQGMGRAVLRTISALDSRAQAIPAPRAELLYGSKLVPAWAVRLLVGTLILPALLAAVDGFARVRRRREPMGRWLAWALAGAVPFVAAWLFALFLEFTGLLPVSPSAPVPAGTIALDGAGTAAMLAVALVAVVGWLA